MDDETGLSTAPEAQSDGLINAIADWLMAEALGDPDLETLFSGCCERLLGAGVPILRGHIASRILHPLYESIVVTWHRGSEKHSERIPHFDGDLPEAWRRSPLFHIIQVRLPFLRRRLTGPEALLDFPILEEFRDAGATDYLGFLIPFDPQTQNGLVGSWTTDHPGGFSERHLRALGRIQKRLAVACKMKIMDEMAHNVVNAYLGPLAGEQVLGGRIKRGDGRAIRAAYWYSDLRESTAMAERLPAEELLATLNDYFDCAAGAVLAHGGEVLMLVGDAVLAIFPVEGEGPEEAAACDAALAAALESGTRLARLNRRRAEAGAPPLAVGVALHLGSAVYGNIGVPERLEFTVVGAAVNEVVRIEGLTKDLGESVLMSRDFADRLSSVCRSLGRFELRGVSGEVEVLAPDGGEGAAESESVADRV